MLVSFIKDGRRFTIPVSQVVVLTDTQLPAAIAYEHAGVIVHSNAAESDFGDLCRELGVRAPEHPTQIIAK